MKKIIFILVFLIFLTSCVTKQTIFINNGEEEIKVKAELADTDEKKERGLMFRKNLRENGGMFFPFSGEGVYSFWMKNTLIPLDIIFIDKNFVIVEIFHAEPCEEEPCENYKTEKYAKYILEVNGDFTTKNNIKIGDKIRLDEK